MLKTLPYRKFNLLSIGAFTLLFIINFLLKVPITSMGFFAFTYDQGRDFLEVSKILYEKNLTLVGQTTGQQGVFYGPTWYYFLSPIFALSNGDPQKIALFFGFFGMVTAMCIYLFLKVQSKSVLAAFLLALIASMSSNWMLGPTVIWNTSLAPIATIGVFYIVTEIKRKGKAVYFFLLGLFLALITDSEMPWGIAMVFSTLILLVAYKKYFYKKNLFLSLTGFLIVFFPKIVFNFKHNFLEFNAIAAFLKEPKVYGTQLSIPDRFASRLEQYLELFSSSFAKNDKTIGLGIILLIGVLIIFISTSNKTRKILKNDFLAIYSLIIISTALILFTLFKDTVWTYYLVGLPIVFLVLISRIFDLSQNIRRVRIFGLALLSLMFVINFNWQIVNPYRITWLGDGAVYRNQKAVMDYIASQKPQNYSVYAYSPAIFDYPFDYLLSWYTKIGAIEKPDTAANMFYLIIRDSDKDAYIKSGWYGDKTKDKTTVIDRQEFTGNILVEKHIRNEN